MLNRLLHLNESPSRTVAQLPNQNWPFQNVAQVSRHYAHKFPDKVALYFDNEADQTHSALDSAADQLAVSLQALGLVKGDVVSFQLPNWHEAAVINLACVRLGLVVNPIVTIYRDREVEYMLSNSQSKAIFVAAKVGSFNYLEMLARLRSKLPSLKHVFALRCTVDTPDCDNLYETLIANGRGKKPNEPKYDVNDVKMLLYTSGTTGNPKGVVHTHQSLYWAMENSRQHWSIDEHDIMLMPSPITHITGFCNGIEFPYYSGGTAAIMEKWNAQNALDYLNKLGATMSLGATPFLQELVDTAIKTDNKAPTLRLFACGGADVPADLIDAANDWFDSISCCRVYGSSESPLVTQGFIAASQRQEAANTDGEVVNYEVQIVANDGSALAVNQIGEVAVRGPAMMLGYLQPEAQNSAFNQQGFFLTGDLGYLTSEKAIVITGRKKDLIIRGGENISAKQIEDVLLEHHAVHEAAVVSMPHDRLGETSCAYVVLQPDKPFLFKQMQDHCDAAKLSKQKFPERLEIIDQLPRTPSGKVKKDVLRKMVRESLTRQTSKTD
jgi:acyl-CoA synthetase